MFKHCIRFICRSAQGFAPLWLVLITLSCLGSAYFLRDIRIDTNIARLLPDDSPVSRSMRTLQEPLGDGGYFSILLHGADPTTLREAAAFISDRAASLPEVAFTSHRNPIEFINTYKYTLLPVSTLRRLYDYALRLEAEVNPFGADLLGEVGQATGDKAARNRQRSLEKSMEGLSSIGEFHENDSGTVIGLIIYPKSMITELERVRRLNNLLEEILQEARQKFQVSGDIGGSQIKNLREYKSIVEDVGSAGGISMLATLAVLYAFFPSLRLIPVVVLPLFVGLAWAFAFVPQTVGPLNIITAFILLILFGMGVDYAIHLVRHFQLERQTREVDEALYATFYTTGRPVIVSSLTTAFPLFILAFSGFRGFSDYGLIGGWSIILMLVATFTVLPVLLVLAERLGIVTPGISLSGSLPPPGRKIALVVLVLIFLLCGYSLGSRELFDYNFQAHSSDFDEARDFDAQHKEVYRRSMVPAALYLAPDLQSLDGALTALTREMEKDGSTIERLASVRDFAPSDEDFHLRLELIAQIREVFQGNWYTKISDPKVRQWIADFRVWQTPEEPATLASLPPEIGNYFLARDGSERFVLGVYPSVSRRNGHEVLAFCDELQRAALPAAVEGPVGEGVIFAEILGIVLGESPTVFLLALLSVALPICLTSSSVREVVLTLMPLVAGIALLLGIMGVVGIKLNYLSIVIIPTLIGLGEDAGVHYYRHCQEHGFDVQRSQKELFGTLSACSLTTMIGYIGLIFAHNRGLQSLGTLACLGMASLWFTSLFLLPALLKKSPQAADGDETGAM